ncbi:hypothetical protein IFM89_029478 [Coptis chinensis]|uniref:DUF4283 domain-containing protein n=1 Tax=Coptis chinensis TaxID=261450 RepID=A0A835LXK4_9MAGN|nr:hypothetical protein IFM89_029478 [Coptis chinensis]
MLFILIQPLLSVAPEVFVSAVYVLYSDDHALKLPYFIVMAGFVCALFAFGIPHLSAMRIYLGVSTVLSLIYNIVIACVLSFQDGEQSSLEAPIVHGNRNRCHVPGVLYNPNTLESFRALDKQSLLNSEANKIWEDIRSGRAVEDSSLLSRFLLISLADLKKSSFNYRFALPALKVDPLATLIDLRPASIYFNLEEVPRIKFYISEYWGNPTRKSYAAAAAKPKYGRSIDASSLPTSGMQGEYPTICLIEEEVDRGIQYCLKSLVGRLDLVKMDLDKVKALVVDKWAPSGECIVTPLGKGFLMFKFDKEEDYTKVWEQGSWMFDSQVLRLSKWTPNFTTEKESQSHAMVWVRFPGLSLEYWEVKNLLAMGKTLGRPMHVDLNHKESEKVGVFCESVLVDIDLSRKNPHKIWVESKKHGVAFRKEVRLGKLRLLHPLQRSWSLGQLMSILEKGPGSNRENSGSSLVG